MRKKQCHSSCKANLQMISINFTDGESDMPVGIQPNHKQSIVLFLERVYGIENQETFFRLLEDAFLPDLRAATMLERVCITRYPDSFFPFNPPTF